ncbi:MAG TPA: tripartite tricarboxylate transporter substrate-binding protein [Reyranella sp.]|nr:tripartite tricarboxylate transporter substrate-binding protein [Reyranella sp.]
MPHPSRRALLGATFASAALAGVRPAAAQKALDTVRIVTGASPGSALDTLCHGVADGLRGTPFAVNAVVENREGFSERLAVQSMKGAATDGSHLLLVRASTLIIFPYIYEKLGYDVFSDLTPVTLACTFEFAFAVGPTVPESVKVLPDFIAWTKANPEQAKFGSPATGTVPHFIGSMLGRRSGQKLKHISFDGTQASVRALMAGKVPAVSAPIGAFLREANAGNIRIIGVSGRTRSRFLPNVPTYAEQGLSDMVFSEWLGFFSPGGTSTSGTLRANAALRSAMKRSDVLADLAADGLEVTSSTPTELALRLNADYERWGPRVKDSGFKSDL